MLFVTLKTVIGGLLEGLKETTAGKVLAGIATIWLKLQGFKLKEKVATLVTDIGKAGRLKDGFGQNLSDMDLSTSTAMASMSA